MENAFTFALNATLPIVLTVAIGYMLKRIGLMSLDFAKMANKLVFRIFLPVMLFMNVYGIDLNKMSSMSFGYVFYGIGGVLLVFALGIPIAIMVTARGDRRGTLLQAFFRSNNALIGIALAEALIETVGGVNEGVVAASIISAFVIPVFNLFGVIALAIFKLEGDEIAAPEGAGEQGARRASGFGFYAKKIGLGVAKNPLIWSILLGFVALGIRAAFVSLDIGFRLNSVDVVWGTLENLSKLATPLALIALGGQFEFSAIGELRREITVGTLVRVLIAPVLTLGTAYLLFRNSFSGAQFAALVAIFCTPVAVSTVPMAQEMGADSKLAGQLVVFSTLFSSLTIFASAFLLKLAGIF